MAKVRVYELAKEFGVESKAVMVKLQEMGEFVRSASSTIEPRVVRRLKEAFAYEAPGQSAQGSRLAAPSALRDGFAERLAAPDGAAASGTSSDAAARRLPPVPPSLASRPGPDSRPQPTPGAPGTPRPGTPRPPVTPADFRSPGQPWPTAPRPGAPGQRPGGAGYAAGSPDQSGQGAPPTAPWRQGPGALRPGAPRPTAPGPRLGAPRPGPRPGNNPFSSTAADMEQLSKQAEITSSSDYRIETNSVFDPVTAAHPGAELPPGLIRELLELWDHLLGFAPDSSLAVRFLAEQSKLPRKEIDRVRRVRNQCAHPGSQGWPRPYDLDLALATARELHRRMRAR